MLRLKQKFLIKGVILGCNQYHHESSLFSMELRRRFISYLVADFISEGAQ